MAAKKLNGKDTFGYLKANHDVASKGFANQENPAPPVSGPKIPMIRRSNPGVYSHLFPVQKVGCVNDMTNSPILQIKNNREICFILTSLWSCPKWIPTRVVQGELRPSPLSNEEWHGLLLPSDNYYISCFNNLFKSSLLGNTVLYLAAKIRLFFSGSIISTMASFLSRHNTIPIVGFSSGSFTFLSW